VLTAWGGRPYHRPSVQDAIDRLFLRAFDVPPAAQEALAGDGSRRRMIRLSDASGRTAIAVIGPDADENRAFLSYSETFRELGLPVPKVYAADEDAGVYLLEDLGDTTLYDALAQARAGGDGTLPAPLRSIYERVLTWLPRFQVEGGAAVDYGVAYPRASFDAQAIQWDLNYFKYHFLKLAHIPFHESRLEQDFQRYIAWLGEAGGEHFVYRDLQTRNVMVRDGEPWFIDYQGGLRGPLQYDVAKLLYEGKAALPTETRAALLENYLDALGEHLPLDREKFLSRYRGFVFLRIMQGMGAYGYLGLYGRKPQFVARIPHAVRDVESLLETGFLPLELPEMRTAFERIVASEALRAAPIPVSSAGLTVRVGSFSYKRGLPEDPGGHGGGFAFDCRALPNPGRLAEFAGLSGLDPAVGTWFERQPSVAAFLAHARELVEAQVSTYLRRGFDSLHVQFGCTGGQHRSVYLAECLARALSTNSAGIDVPVRHAEAVHWPVTAARSAPSVEPSA